MQKLNYILKIFFNNDKQTSRAKKSRHSIRSKQNGALEIAVSPRYSHCVHTEYVRKSMFKIYVKCSNQ